MRAEGQHQLRKLPSQRSGREFFQLLKRDRIRRQVYATRDQARGEIFDYIEMFYNRQRRHGFNDQLSPVEYEKRHQERLENV